MFSHAHWGHHHASFSSSFGFHFGLGHGGFGNWGYYSYPYYYGASLPSYYSQCYGGLGAYAYRNYGFGLGLWLWPRSCYYPSRWIFGSSIWCDPYDLYYSPTRSYAGINRTSAPSDEEVLVAGDAAPAAESRPSEADIAAAEAERKLELARRHITLGDFYFRSDRFKDAAESYMRALVYAPEDGSLHFLIADALFAQGDYHYAAHMIQMGIELDPTLALADVDKREFYGETATFDAQMKTLRGYTEDKPYDAAAQLVLGYNLNFSADPKGAKTAFQRVLEIRAGDRAAAAFLEAASDSR